MAGPSVGITILTGGAGQAAGSLVGPATEAGKGIYQCLKRKYYYIKNLHQHFENLEGEANYLSSRQRDMNKKIEDNQTMMEITDECATWLQDVSKLLKTVEELKTKYEMVVNGSCGLCWLRARLKLSREIEKKIHSIVDLKNRMDIELEVLAMRRPDKVEKKYPKNINEVPSLHEHVKKLSELLADNEIRKIGIWGMPGVGKSTILENLNDQVERLNVFDIVLFVKVSKQPDFRMIQQEILKRLGVKVEDIETKRQSAGLISKILEHKKYLLLLDEVFSEFDLREMGIHDNHSFGKVVLATREKMICNSMDTDEEIKVERLSTDDAWKLFHFAVGEAVCHPVIKPIAMLVLKQCGELPHIIRAVGRYLKDKFNEDVWWNTLSQLKSPIMYQLQDMEDVFNSFKCIYEELPAHLQNCLLYATSFPEDHEIFRDHLIECWRAEQLIGINETFRRTREQGQANLSFFIDKCLFDSCKSSKSVKIPIIFRNTAHKMADRLNYGLLLRHSEGWENPSNAEWVGAKVISLINSNQVQLPPRPNCSVVSTLFLQKNNNLSVLPPLFFDYMSTLRILDLCGTRIDSLPPSISNLISLKGLYLNDCCKLMHLPQEINGLQNLELLDICRTGIRGFPLVLGSLTTLKCLRVSFASSVGCQNCVEANGIRVTPHSETISQLLLLEELTIDADPKDKKWSKIALTIIKSVADLEKLSTLSLCFPNTESLETFIHTSKSWRNNSSKPGNNFRSFNIIVGSRGAFMSPKVDAFECSARRYLQYAGGKGTPNAIKEVLKKSCVFELIDHVDINNFSDFEISGMECMEFCHIEGCNTMTSFLSNQILETPALPWLRELHLLKLPRLNALCQGPSIPGSFAKLTTLTLCDCPNVIELVSWEMAKQLHELQTLNVEKCSLINEIVSAATEPTTGMDAFPKLKNIKLVMLDNLIRIHHDDSFVWRALENLEIIECNQLVNICLSTGNATKLSRIRCDGNWWATTVLLNEQVRAQLQLLCSFS